MAYDLKEFGQAWWFEISKKVKRAVVFIDERSAECLHWHGGLALLEQAGAVAVKEFSFTEFADPVHKKAVFIISSAFFGSKKKTLEDIVRKSKLQYCVLITGAAAAVHQLLQHGGREGDESLIFSQLEEQVLQWMGNMNYTFELFSHPIFTIALNSHCFLTPPFRDCLPLLESDIDWLAKQHSYTNKADVRPWDNLADVDFSRLPLSLQAQVKQLVYNFHQLFTQWNVKEDIFTLGDWSRIVATELEALLPAKARRKTASKKVSILFIDRILDLAGPSSFVQANETLLDKINVLLPKLPGHSNEVAIPMHLLATAKPDPLDEVVTVAPGCLAPPYEGKSAISSLIYHKPKLAMQDIQSQLAEILDENGLEVPVSENSANYLRNQVLAFKDRWDLIEDHIGLLQTAIALLQTFEHPDCGKLEQLMNLEKVLMQNVIDESTPPLPQIIQLVKTRKEKKMSLEDILLLILHLYALSNDPDWAEEYESKLEDVLAEAFVQDEDTLTPFIHSLVGVPVDEVKAHRAAQKVVTQMRSISAARTALKKHKSVFEHSNNPSLPVRYVSLLHQVLQSLFEPAKTDIPDIEYRSGGLKDLLKTSFSLFVNVKKPHPLDNPTLIIFVLGGISPNEIKLVRDFTLNQDRSDVYIGATHMINPTDTLDYLLGREHFSWL